MNSAPQRAQEAIELARKGETAKAIDAALLAIDADPDDCGLRVFIALLYSRQLKLAEARTHLENAVRLAPLDSVPRAELIRVLIGLGDLDLAERHLSETHLKGLESNRLRATILARRNRHNEAIQLLQQIVAVDPNDYESWGSVGACFLANGQPRMAVEALSRAVQLRPDMQKFRLALMDAQVEAGGGEVALANARSAATQNPLNLAASLEIARLEELLGRPDEALKVLRATIAEHPDDLPTLIALATMLERQNQVVEFGETVDTIKAIRPESAELLLLRALLAMRRGDHHQALRLAESAPPSVNAGLREELIGKANDRLGNSEAAFCAFEKMNQESGLSAEVIARRSAKLRALIDYRAHITTHEWVDGWPQSANELPIRSPAFLIGFPRSGTTLLDTFLMGHGDVCVAEEKPLLRSVGERLGSYDRIAALDGSEIEELRSRYFEAAEEHVPDLGDRLLIDKYPLGAIEIALIHRLFPKAPIIFAQRHPCDVVLSCFFTRFQPAPSLISFFTLEDAATLYDKVMSFWEQTQKVMSLRVHNVRYEDLVGAARQEMRKVVEFLDLAWDDNAGNHEEAAARRSFITNASYAQVAEPLNRRSIGRWSRYRAQMSPVLPLLNKWSRQLGYGDCA